MSSTSPVSDAPTAIPHVPSCNMRLEVVELPVARCRPREAVLPEPGLAARCRHRSGRRVPGSAADSAALGVLDCVRTGLTTGEPGSVKRLLLMVDDVDAAREDVARCGVEVSDVFHLDGGRIPGRDPENRSYQSYAAFSDPDGNEWLCRRSRLGCLAASGRTDCGRRVVRRAAPRNGGASRPVREDPGTTQLVGLVRRLRRRAPAREDARRSGGRRRPIHRRSPARGGAVNSSLEWANPNRGD